MLKYIYDFPGQNLIRVVDEVPVCGRDFCDECGDCLACNGSEPCYHDGQLGQSHFWVQYGEDAEQDDAI